MPSSGRLPPERKRRRHAYETGLQHSSAILSVTGEPPRDDPYRTPLPRKEGRVADDVNAEDLREPTPLRGRRSKAEFASRMARMRELVGYSADDELAVRATREIVLVRAGAIAEAVYARILEHPETRGYFVDEDGKLDPQRVAMRPEALSRWLLLAVETSPGPDLATALAVIGRAHTKRGGAQGVRINGRYLVGMMSVVQSELSAAITDAQDAGDALRSIGAWSRLLTIHLDLLLAVYGSAEGNPHWY